MKAQRNDPPFLAETISDRCDSVPWPLTCFVTVNARYQNINVVSFKSNDPACERYRRNKKGIEVGTYTAKARHSDIVRDLEEAILDL